MCPPGPSCSKLTTSFVNKTIHFQKVRAAKASINFSAKKSYFDFVSMVRLNKSSTNDLFWSILCKKTSDCINANLPILYKVFISFNAKEFYTETYENFYNPPFIILSSVL